MSFPDSEVIARIESGLIDPPEAHGEFCASLKYLWADCDCHEDMADVAAEMRIDEAKERRWL